MELKEMVGFAALGVLWVFIGLFALTGLVTLAALPNWIKIRDSYVRRRLFQGFIVEVGIGIVSFFTIYFLTPSLKEAEWVAIRPNGEILRCTPLSRQKMSRIKV